MKGYKSDKIRNIVLLGHGSTGKTTFLEAGLLNTKVISRLGKVESGNTVSDYEKMEIEKGYTINQTLVPVEYNGTKLNFIDTPGFFDFAGEARAALSTGATAIIMVDASSGIQVGTEKAWDLVKEFNQRLAPYKRIKHVFVRKQDFVRTTTRKIRRQDNPITAETVIGYEE